MPLLGWRTLRFVAVVGLAGLAVACGGDTDGGLCGVSSNLPNVSVGISTGACDDAPALSKIDQATPVR